MNVLSVFDGMSCGQIALERAGIKVDNYFASEIDKYAIQITQKNYPNTHQLGDINNWKSWKLPKIDLLIGGSPCQGFSFAGRGLNFDDPRSRLFFVYAKILKRYQKKNPDMKFLLENVRMKKEHQAVISEYLGVEPVMIDSALVSAQSRKRLYWTNIGKIEPPEDKGILLRDIIQDDSEIDEKYLYSLSHAGYVKNVDQKAGCLTGGAHSGGNHSDMTLLPFPRIDVVANVYPSKGQNGNIYSTNGKSPSLSAGIGIKGRGIGSSNAPKILINSCIQVGEAEDIKGYDIVRRVYSSNGKSPTLTDMQGGHRQPKVALDLTHYRKLTPLECERLQTVPDGYTEGVSNTQRYKMLGNGWTVDVIVHIFSYLPKS